MKTELNLDPIKAQLDAVETVYGRNWKLVEDDGEDQWFLLTEDSAHPYSGDVYTPICITPQENTDLREFLRTGLDVQRNLVAEVERLRTEISNAVDALTKPGRDAYAVAGSLEDGINTDHMHAAAERDGLAAEIKRLTEALDDAGIEQHESIAWRVQDMARVLLQTEEERDSAREDAEQAEAEVERLQKAVSDRGSMWADVHGLIAEFRDSDRTDNELTNAVMALIFRDAPLTSDQQGGSR